MGDARPLSHQLLDMLEPRLANLGFKRTGPKPRSSFTKRTDDGTAGVHIQRSWTSERNRLRVTANLTATLDVLQAFDNAAGWATRIGHLLPGGNDYWWEIWRASFENDAQPLIEAVVSVGAPEAIRHASKETMLAEWSGGGRPFETEPARLLGLGVLMFDAGREAEARQALERALQAAEPAALGYWEDLVGRVSAKYSGDRPT